MDLVLELGASNTELLRRMLADVDPAVMCRQPNGVKNHATWQTGHVTVVRSILAGMLGGKPAVPESWMPTFGPGSEPLSDLSKYPSKAELQAAYAEANASLVAAIRGAGDDVYARPNPIESLQWLFPTMRHLAAGILTTHDSLHLGQLSVWRRQMGLPRVI